MLVILISGGAWPKDRTPRLRERMQVFLVGVDVD